MKSVRIWRDAVVVFLLVEGVVVFNSGTRRGYDGLAEAVRVVRLSEIVSSASNAQPPTLLSLSNILPNSFFFSNFCFVVLKRQTEWKKCFYLIIYRWSVRFYSISYFSFFFVELGVLNLYIWEAHLVLTKINVAEARMSAGEKCYYFQRIRSGVCQVKNPCFRLNTQAYPIKICRNL